MRVITRIRPILAVKHGHGTAAQLRAGSRSVIMQPMKRRAAAILLFVGAAFLHVTTSQGLQAALSACASPAANPYYQRWRSSRRPHLSRLGAGHGH